MFERPNPLGNVASKVGAAWSAVAAVVAYLATAGVLTAAQADAVRAAGEAAPETITQVGAAVAAVITLVGGLVSAFRVASAGRDEVTPVTDPRAADGTPLIPAPVTALPDVPAEDVD